MDKNKANPAAKEPEANVTLHMQHISLRKKKTKAGEFSVMDAEWDEVTQSKDGADISPMSKGGSREIHKDLAKSLKLCVPHFLILAELRQPGDFSKTYFEKEEVLKDISVESFAVTGIHWKEKGENPYVILVGRKILKNQRVISMTLPMVGLSQTEEGYVHAEQLAKAVECVLTEAEAYLAGKYAPRQDLFEGQGEPAKLKKVG